MCKRTAVGVLGWERDSSLAGTVDTAARLALQVFATAKAGPDVLQLQMIASQADSLPFSIYLWHFSVESLSTRVRRTLLRTWLIIAKTRGDNRTPVQQKNPCIAPRLS